MNKHRRMGKGHLSFLHSFHLQSLPWYYPKDGIREKNGSIKITHTSSSSAPLTTFLQSRKMICRYFKDVWLMVYLRTWRNPVTPFTLVLWLGTLPWFGVSYSMVKVSLVFQYRNEIFITTLGLKFNFWSHCNFQINSHLHLQAFSQQWLCWQPALYCHLAHGDQYGEESKSCCCIL